jgi:hypothetical protein
MLSVTRRTTLLVALLVAVVGTLLQPAAAGAAPPMPDGLLPAGTSVGANPSLSWDATAGATKYRIQIAQVPSFAPMLVSTDTVATTYAPQTELPNGTIYWRVAAVDGSGMSDYAEASFQKTARPGPMLSAPQDGGTIDFPGSAPTFSWEPVAGSKSYVLELDDADDFIGSTKYVTLTNAYTLTGLAGVVTPGQTAHWRVTGASNANGTGVLTFPSSTRSFTVEWDEQPELTSPEDTTLTAVDDVVLEWEPTPGARNYQLEVSTSADFSGTLIENRTVFGTRYSPATTYLNGSYYWRVRARDQAGNLGPWSMGDPPRQFRRAWDDFPTTVFPADAAADPPGDEGSFVDAIRFQWTAVQRASYYELEIHPLDGSSVSVCRTVHTSVTPHTGDSKPPPGAGCMGAEPAAWFKKGAGLYRWRVRGFDATRHVPGIWSDFSWVDYQPIDLGPAEPPDDEHGATPLAPAHCSPMSPCELHTSTPTLRWTPVDGATHYRVWVAVDQNFTNVKREYRTRQTVLTPREELEDNTAGEAYYWHVSACLGAIGSGPCYTDPRSKINPPSSAFRKQSLAVELQTPADQTTVADLPVFTWRPYLHTQSEAQPPSDLEASHYRIQTSSVSTFATLIENVTVDQTTYTPHTRTYPEGPIYWRVRAVDTSGNERSWSETRLVTKSSPAVELSSPANASTVVGVPTLDWEPQAYAAQYQVEIAKNGDTAFSPANRVLLVTTMHSAYTPHDKTLPPGQYAWRVRRKDASGLDGPWNPVPAPPPSSPANPLRTFTVSPTTIELTGPANHTTFTTNDLLFSWTGLQGAASYRFQRSNVASFASVQETRDTVMTAWAPLTVIGDGTWYWRVQALDSVGQVIGQSPARQFLKDGTRPLAPSKLPTANLPLKGPFTVTFSEPVTGVSASSFKVTVAGTNTAIAGNVTQPTPTTATWVPKAVLMPGQTYTASLTGGVKDLNGNSLLPTSWNARTALLVENTSPAVTYEWDNDRAATASGGGYDESRRAGTKKVFTFDGTTVSVVGRRGPDGGYADVIIDGQKAGRANFHRNSVADQQVVFQKTGLSSGKHRLELRVTGTKPAASKGTWVRVDAFRSGAGTFQERAKQVKSLWTRAKSPGANGGNVDRFVHKKDAGGGLPLARFRFRGTRFEWIAQRSPSGGQAAVFVGGKRAGVVDLYSPTKSDRQRVFALSGLPDKVHKVELRALGTKQPASKGTDVNVDYVTVG